MIANIPGSTPILPVQTNNSTQNAGLEGKDEGQTPPTPPSQTVKVGDKIPGYNGNVLTVEKVRPLLPQAAARLAKIIAAAEDAWNRQVLTKGNFTAEEIAALLPAISTVDPKQLQDKLSEVTLAFGTLRNRDGVQLGFGGVVKKAYPTHIFFPSTGIKRGTLAHEAVHVGQLAGLIERKTLNVPSHLADRDYGPELKEGVVFSKLNAEEQAEWVEAFAKSFQT